MTHDDLRASRGPRLARLLVQRVVGAPDAEAIIGDLEEGLAGGRSRTWYWSQAIGSSLAWMRRGLRGGGLWYDLRFAGRKLLTQPAFTLVVVIVLALGIGANAAIFSVVNGILLSPLPYDQPQRLALIRTSLPNQGARHVPASPVEFGQIERDARSFESVGGVWYRPAALTDAASLPEDIDMAFVTAGFLPTLGVEPLLGRYPSVQEDVGGEGPVIVLSEGLWRRRYGADPDIIGTTIDMDDSPHMVVGVMPGDFLMHLPPEVNMPAQPQAWVTFGGRYEEYGRTFRTFTIVGRLANGSTTSSATAALAAVAADIGSEHPEYSGTGYALDVQQLDASVVSEARPLLILLLGAVGLVLLTVCANVANLYLARSAVAQRELAVRHALGASKGRLLRGLASECLLITGIGAALGMLLAQALVAALPLLAPADLPRIDAVGLDLRVVGYAALLAAATALIFAVVSAVGLGHNRNHSVLQAATRVSGTKATARLRSGMLVAELAFSLMLLIGVGLMARSFSNLAEVDPGFDPRGVSTMKLSLVDTHFFYAEPQKIADFYRELSQQVAALPGVEAAGITTHLPSLSRTTKPFVHETDDGETEWGANAADYKYVTPGWMEAMGVRLLSGRFFEWQDDLEHPIVAIVDDTLAASAWPGEDPVGQRLKVEVFSYSERRHEWAEVVGVVEHLRHDVSAGGLGQVFIPHGQTPMRTTVLTVRADGQQVDLATAVPAIVTGLDGDQPVGPPVLLEEYMTATLATRRFALALLSAFSALAVVVAMVGTYGVVSYGVAQRTREIGIQMAIGASPGDVVRAVVVPGARLAILGAVLGMAGAAMLGQSLAGFLFEVDPVDPFTFAGIAALMTIVAVFACYLPARRASQLDPTVALRES